MRAFGLETPAPSELRGPILSSRASAAADASAMRIAVRFVRLSAVLALLLASAGCFELLAEVRFRADGTVQQQVRYGMSERAMKRFEKFLRAAPVPGRTGLRPETVFDEEAIRAEVEEAGGEVVAFSRPEVEVNDAKAAMGGKMRRAHVTAEFPDLATFSASPLLGTRAEWFFLEGEPGQVRLVCYPLGRDAWQRARFDAHRLESEGDTLQSQVFESRKAELEGLVLKCAIGVPGRVVAASKGLFVPTHRGGVIAGIDVEAIKTPADLVRAMAPRWEIVFEPGEELAGIEIARTEPR
jgi:hypothetical protein